MTFSQLFGRERTKNRNLRQIFLDEAAYAQEIESIAIGTASRISRGGVALQMMDIITERQFQSEMDVLEHCVEESDSSD